MGQNGHDSIHTTFAVESNGWYDAKKIKLIA